MFIHHFNRLIRNKWVWGVFAVIISAFFAFDFLLPRGDGDGRSGRGAGSLAGEDVKADEFTAYSNDIAGYGRSRRTDVDGRELNRQAWENIAAVRTGKKLGMAASEDDVRQTILGIPAMLTGELYDNTRDLTAFIRQANRDNTLFSDLKDLAGRSREMDDDELYAAVLALAEQHGVHLVDSQAWQLVRLCRALEKLDAGQLRERFDALERELDSPGGLRGAWEAVKRAVTDAADWIARTVGGWFR